MKQAIGVVLTLMMPLVANAQAVTLTDLGVSSDPGSFFSVGKALNNAGVVVVTSGASTPGTPFVWQSGTMSAVPTLSGNNALSINNAGAISGTQGMTAAVYANGSTQVLGTLNGGGASSAIAINNQNQVVGISAYSTGTVAPVHAFLWTNGQMTDIGNFSPKSINDAGAVAGSRNNGIGAQAITWQNGTVSDLPSLLSNPYSTAAAINSFGHVAGTSYSFAYGTYGQELDRATLWANETAIDLIPNANTVSRANAINSAGDVVGNMADLLYPWVFTPNKAFLWRSGALYDLNALVSGSMPGWQISDAIAINDQGQILAVGKFQNNWQHAVLLTVSAVPEPSSVALFSLGLGLLTHVRRRYRKNIRPLERSCLRDPA